MSDNGMMFPGTWIELLVDPLCLNFPAKGLSLKLIRHSYLDPQLELQKLFSISVNKILIINILILAARDCFE